MSPLFINDVLSSGQKAVFAKSENDVKQSQPPFSRIFRSSMIIGLFYSERKLSLEYMNLITMSGP